MTARQVFIDTAGLIAVVNRDDGLHEKAKSAWQDLTQRGVALHTTEWVLSEFLGSLSKHATRQNASKVVHAFLSSSRAHIVAATHEDWQRGFQLYQARPDKEWSLVDCISILLCEDRSIRQVFTHDRHFVQAGYEILL